MYPTPFRPLPWLALVSLVAAGCSPAEGLRRTPQGEGPVVVIDYDADPLPEIPFPNDLATRVDPDSPTGLRLNLSEEASTELERDTRRKVNQLDGFGVFTPISVRFDAPLDLGNIAGRHRDDYDTSDDAVLVVNVTPGSPDFGEAAELDVGNGRFPGDLYNPGAYFANDARSMSPSLLFETVEEDLNGNGELDEGEDTDGDGVLDHPNVFPTGGDSREDLLTWYERETNTLIVRPVVPLLEQTTYAVVLTDRLTDTAGNPVRSPWPWVNHTRQTSALEPLIDTLPALNLSVDQVAFAWTFTTGRITGDLVDVTEGLRGNGPYGWLADEYPPAVYAAARMTDPDDGSNPFHLDPQRLIGIIDQTGEIPDGGADVLREGYRFTQAIVGGSFTSPYLLIDTDDSSDGTGDDTDEIWQLDRATGTMNQGPQDIAFTCAIPKASDGFEQPYPVVLFGHGYGSNRLESLMFAWAMPRVGYAACSMDFPGHGLAMGEDDAELVAGLLEAAGMLPAWDHLMDGRVRDMDNDGRGDSGADQWIADGFHVSGMVRQAVVDWTQMIRSLKACGQTTWDGDIDGDGVDEVSCDWDGDGTPDIGGEDNPYFIMGGSLGGINGAVASAVMPEVSAFIPIVGGGGFMDIGWRSDLGGVVEAVPGRLMSPMFIGLPQTDGRLEIAQLVNSVRKMRTLHVGWLDEIPAGGTVRIENLHNGEVREQRIPDDGRFRLGIPSDALDYYERRAPSGMPLSGPVPGQVYEIPDNEGLGDRIRLTFKDALGYTVGTIETWDSDVVHEGVTMRAGSPLVAATEGLGHMRNTPKLRRVVNVLSLITESGDPIAYAPYMYDRPMERLGGDPANVLLMPTVGDNIVCVATEIALARAAGAYDRHSYDERYGMHIDRWLVENDVIHGMEEFGPWRDRDGNPQLFDPDDLDDNADEYGAPSDAPLRATVDTTSGQSGMRIPYISPRGSHGFTTPSPDKAFDMTTFAIGQGLRYFQTLGQEISDERCLEDLSCPYFRTLDELDGAER